jgi:hypothetical protein
MPELAEQTPILTKKYSVEFRYSDDLQLYTADIQVTPEELERIKKFFEAMLEHGYILAADNTNSDTIDNVVFETHDYEPLTFEQFSKSYERGDTLIEYAEELGIIL